MIKLKNLYELFEVELGKNPSDEIQGTDYCSERNRDKGHDSYREYKEVRDGREQDKSLVLGSVNVEDSSPESDIIDISF